LPQTPIFPPTTETIRHETEVLKWSRFPGTNNVTAIILAVSQVELPGKTAINMMDSSITEQDRMLQISEIQSLSVKSSEYVHSIFYKSAVTSKKSNLLIIYMLTPLHRQKQQKAAATY
jgi:hypothetical protein